MLRVTIEMVPFGIESCKRTIGVQEIALLKNRNGIGEYRSRLEDDADFPPEQEEVFLKHDRSKGAWPLIARALEKHCGN